MVPGFDRLQFAEAHFRGDVDIEGWYTTLSTEFITGRPAGRRQQHPPSNGARRLRDHRCGIPAFALRDEVAACALEFESGEIGVYQLLASRRAAGLAALPLTRQHLHCGDANPAERVAWRSAAFQRAPL